MNLLAWDPIDKKMGVVDTYHPKTGKVMFENDTWDWYKRDRIVRRPTGLKDKNGIKIYEGDRFRSHKSAGKSVGTIEYIEDGFKVVWDEPNYGCLNNILRIHAEDGEVIGDIYETPELLEVNHD